MKKFKLNHNFFKILGISALASTTIISASLTIKDQKTEEESLPMTTSLEEPEESLPVMKTPSFEEIYASVIADYASSLENLTAEETYETFIEFLKTNESNLNTSLNNLKLKTLMQKLDLISAYQEYYEPDTLRFFDNTQNTLNIPNLAYLLGLCYSNDEYNIYRYFLDNGEPAWFITTKDDTLIYATTYESSTLVYPSLSLISLKDYLETQDLTNYSKMKYTLGDLVITLFGINDKISSKYNSSQISSEDVLIITNESILNSHEGNISPLYILIPKETYAFGSNITVYQDIINPSALIKVHVNKKGFEYLDFQNQVSMRSYLNGDSKGTVFIPLYEFLTKNNLQDFQTKDNNYNIYNLTLIYQEAINRLTSSKTR